MGSWWAFEILCFPSSIIINQLPSVCQALVIFKDLLIHFVKFHETSQELSLELHLSKVYTGSVPCIILVAMTTKGRKLQNIFLSKTTGPI